MQLIFKTAPDLEVVGTSELDNLPVEVIDIEFDSWCVKFSNGRRLHAFVDELWIKS